MHSLRQVSLYHNNVIFIDWLKKINLCYLCHNKIDIKKASIHLTLYLNFGYFNVILNVKSAYFLPLIAEN